MTATAPPPALEGVEEETWKRLLGAAKTDFDTVGIYSADLRALLSALAGMREEIASQRAVLQFAKEKIDAARRLMGIPADEIEDELYDRIVAALQTQDRTNG